LCDVRDPRRLNLVEVTWFGSIGPDELVGAADALRRTGVAALHRHVLDGDVLAHVRALSDAERHWTDLEHLFELLAREFTRAGVARSSPRILRRVLQRRH
jgi:hypothetical protein